MEFFDPKEEVLEITLTSYGRQLMSLGEFDAHYYSFFDDDILYDARWASIYTETQNEIEGRIQDETPRFKQPTAFAGIETNYDQNVAAITTAIDYYYGTPNPEVFVQDTYDRNIYNQEVLEKDADQFDFLSFPIGTSELASDKYPGWRVDFLLGALSGSTDYFAKERRSDRYVYEPIPQLNITLEYKVYVEQVSDSPILSALESVSYSAEGFPVPDETLQGVPGEVVAEAFERISSQLFSDGTYFHLKDGKILLDIKEYNTLFKKENFEIQVFLSSSAVSAGDPGSLELLRFADEQTQEYGTKNVEKYLSVNVDREIQDASLKSAGFDSLEELRVDSAVSSVVSTREFFIKDLYAPDSRVCVTDITGDTTGTGLGDK
tara:strand:+ start:2128 stop:3258 length:1131 start_codon:yes stop_codon:yes gene_type:complete